MIQITGRMLFSGRQIRVGMRIVDNVKGKINYSLIKYQSTKKISSISHVKIECLKIILLFKNATHATVRHVPTAHIQHECLFVCQVCLQQTNWGKCTIDMTTLYCERVYVVNFALVHIQPQLLPYCYDLIFLHFP